MLADKLNLVKKNIEEACDTAGRSPQEVTLIAVSKTKPVEMLKEAYDAGARVFGENKVQEIVDKYDQMPSDVQWHMIGHLQRNKVKYIIDKLCRFCPPGRGHRKRGSKKRYLHAGSDRSKCSRRGK